MTDVELQELMTRLETLTNRLEGVAETTASPAGELQTGPSGNPQNPAPTPRVTGAAPADPWAKADTYRRTLCDTVAVLEATRTSFRSKRLKELRERIEAVLEEETE